MKKIMPVWLFVLLSSGYVMGELAFNDVVVNFEPPESQPSSIRSFVLYESGSARIQSQEKFEGNQSLEMKGPSAIGIELVNPAEIYQFSFQCKINSLDEDEHTGLDLEILDSSGFPRLKTWIEFSSDMPRDRFFEIRIELLDYHAYQIFVDGKPYGSEKALSGSKELGLSKLILHTAGYSSVLVDDIHILTKAGYKYMDGLYEAQGVLVGFPNGEGTFEMGKIPSVLMKIPHEMMHGVQGIDSNKDSVTEEIQKKKFSVPDFKQVLRERLEDQEEKAYSLTHFNVLNLGELYLIRRRNQMLQLDVQMSKRYSEVEKSREMPSPPFFDQNLKRSVSMLDKDESTKLSSNSKKGKKYSAKPTTPEVTVPSGGDISDSARPGRA